MLLPDKVSEIHRLHFTEKWPARKIARHLRIGRRTIAKYLKAPAPPPTHRDRASKLDGFKAAINDMLRQDPSVNAPVVAQNLRPLGYDGGVTIVKDYLRAVRLQSSARRAYVRVEPGPGERFDVDWGHFGALTYNGATRKLYAFCLIDGHSRKMFLEFTHSQSFETFARCLQRDAVERGDGNRRRSSWTHQTNHESAGSRRPCRPISSRWIEK
jgi:transposase